MVGGAIGWYLDKWLGTTPWLFVIFFFLGVAAGFRNVYKAAQKIGGELPPEQDK
ncbi:MAG: AtpZ/AtpI family protein [Proteobacteria bacterium]|nr:AtpZ/AtpI family protein [Pseudomonadota bacterium]MCH7925892.1 AtpZ/AtpI family protein [Planctomycetota bacterium]